MPGHKKITLSRKGKVGRLAMLTKIGRCVKNKKYFLKMFNCKILALGWAKLVSPEPSAMNLQSDLKKIFFGFVALPSNRKNLYKSFIPLENGSTFVLHEKPLFYLNYALEPPKYVSK